MPQDQAAAPAQQRSPLRLLKRLGRWFGRLMLLALLLGLLAGAGYLGVYLYTLDGYYVQKLVIQNPTLTGFTTGGKKLHAITFGDSTQPMIVGLHDGPGIDSKHLLPLRQLSRAGFFVVLYDRRGTGLSQRTVCDSLTRARHLRDLQALIDHYNEGQPVHLIAQGWGARLAMDYCLRHPQQIAKAALLQPQLQAYKAGGRPRQRGYHAYRAANRWERWLARMEGKHIQFKGDPTKRSDHIITRLWEQLPDYRSCGDSTLDSTLQLPLHRGGFRATRCQLPRTRQAYRPPTGPLSDSLTTAMLLMRCRCNANVRISAKEDEAIPAGVPYRKQAVRGCRRFPLQEAPDQVLAQLKAFLEAEQPQAES
jgi:pimeloyl-ACP methyl ester carboxylesterase